MHKYFLALIICLFLTGCQAGQSNDGTPTQRIYTRSPEATSAPAASTSTAIPEINHTITEAPSPAATSSAMPDKMSQNLALWKQSPHAGQNISCEGCHGPAPKNGAYLAIANGLALCSKCHLEPENSSGQAGQSDPVHAGLDCVNCHNPHSTTATCNNSGCHQTIRKPGSMPPSTPTGGHPQIGSPFCGGPSCHPAATQAALADPSIHGSVHSSIACIACHAGSGVQVTRSDVTGAWKIVVPDNKVGTSMPHLSNLHNITLQVDCTRCHFKGNSWSLPLVSGHEFGN